MRHTSAKVLTGSILKEANAYTKIKKAMANKNLMRMDLLEAIEEIIRETEEHKAN